MIECTVSREIRILLANYADEDIRRAFAIKGYAFDKANSHKGICQEAVDKLLADIAEFITAVKKDEGC